MHSGREKVGKSPGLVKKGKDVWGREQKTKKEGKLGPKGKKRPPPT